MQSQNVESAVNYGASWPSYHWMTVCSDKDECGPTTFWPGLNSWHFWLLCTFLIHSRPCSAYSMTALLDKYLLEGEHISNAASTDCFSFSAKMSWLLFSKLVQHSFLNKDYHVARKLNKDFLLNFILWWVTLKRLFAFLYRQKTTYILLFAIALENFFSAFQSHST